MERENPTRKTHKGEFVKATNTETNEVKLYKNGMDASRGIGCSHVLAYKALNGQVATAHGWRLEYIDKDDPQCAKYKRMLETRIRNVRQSLVEYAREQIQERKQFVEDGKARRKAEHDEFVRIARGMVANALQSLKEQLEREAQDYKQTFANYHAIVQLTMDGEVVREWKNAHQAQIETNIKNIRQVVLGLRRSAGGYRWEFLVPIEGLNEHRDPK